MGKITAQIVSYIFREDISRSRGIRITCLGSAMAQTIRLKTMPRPQNRFFAST